MPENYYEDAEIPPSASTSPAEKEEPMESETTVIPKSLCPGMKVGDTVNLKIVRELENEYEVAYGERDRETDIPEPESAPQMAPASMDQMME